MGEKTKVLVVDDDRASPFLFEDGKSYAEELLI